MLEARIKMISTKSTTRRRTKHQKGGTLVESALVMLTMLGMIIFVLDMGRILLTEQFVTERARVTVRQAAVNNWNAADVQNYLVYDSITAPPVNGQPEAGAGTTSGLLGLFPSQVSYTTLGTSGTPDYRLQVRVSGIPAFTWIPFIARSYTLPPVMATMPAQSLGATN
jgi:Flp pilus assembly protein TadG